MLNSIITHSLYYASKMTKICIHKEPCLLKQFKIRTSRVSMKERKEEIIYLMIHSKQLYGIRHIVMDHRNNDRKPAANSCAAFSEKQQGIFYMHPPDKIEHTMGFVIPFEQIAQ